MTVGEATSQGGLATRDESAGARRAPAVQRAYTSPAVVIAASIALLPLIKPTGPGNASPVDVVIVLALLASLAWAIVERPRLRLPFVGATGMYIGAGALAALLGPLPGTGMLAVAQEIALLAWALAIANTLRGAADVALVLRTWVWAALSWAAAMIIGYALRIDWLAGFDPEFGDRAALTFADPNMAGTYFMVTVMVVWATQVPHRRWLRLGAYAVLLTALALAGSNGSFAALAVAIGVAAIVRTAHRSGVLGALALAAAGLLAAVVLVVGADLAALQERAGESGRTGELTLGRSDQSIDSRVLLKQLGLELYGEGDLVGSGPNSAAYLLERRQAPVATELHDDYLATLVERGLVGFGGLVLLIGSVAYRTRALFHPARRRRKELPHWANRSNEEALGVAFGVLKPWALGGAFAGFATAALFYEILHFRHLWALFGIVAAIQLWRSR